MVSLFKDRSPATTTWVLILSIVVHGNFFVHPPLVHTLPYDGLLAAFLNEYVSDLSTGALIFIYNAVVILQALRLNHLFTDNRMYNRVNYLPAMVYILLTGLFKEWTYISPALIDNSLVIWFFAKTVRLYNHPNPKTLIFNIGLIIGASILLYHPSAILIIVALFAIMIVRPFVVTEWLVLLMGVIFPFYFVASYLYLTDKINTISNYIPAWTFNLPHVQPTIMLFATISVIVIVLIIGLIYSQRENRRLLIQIRKNWVVLMVMLFAILPVPFINRDAGLESALLWIVPASPFIAKGFLAPKKETLPKVMFWTLFALTVINTWGLIKK